MRRSLSLLALGAALLAAPGAWAQQDVTPPALPPGGPALAPPPTTQPPVAPPTGQSPAQEPPPPATPPTTPPVLAPEPSAAAPPLVLDQRAQVAPEAPQPFYRKTWFWGALGLVLATTAVILVASAGSAGPPTPATNLGNMHAF